MRNVHAYWAYYFGFSLRDWRGDKAEMRKALTNQRTARLAGLQRLP